MWMDLRYFRMREEGAVSEAGEVVRVLSSLPACLPAKGALIQLKLQKNKIGASFFSPAPPS